MQNKVSKTTSIKLISFALALAAAFGLLRVPEANAQATSQLGLSEGLCRVPDCAHYRVLDDIINNARVAMDYTQGCFRSEIANESALIDVYQENITLRNYYIRRAENAHTTAFVFGVIYRAAAETALALATAGASVLNEAGAEATETVAQRLSREFKNLATARKNPDAVEDFVEAAGGAAGVASEITSTIQGAGPDLDNTDNATGQRISDTTGTDGALTGQNFRLATGLPGALKPGSGLRDSAIGNEAADQVKDIVNNTLTPLLLDALEKRGFDTKSSPEPVPFDAINIDAAGAAVVDVIGESLGAYVEEALSQGKFAPSGLLRASNIAAVMISSVNAYLDQLNDQRQQRINALKDLNKTDTDFINRHKQTRKQFQTNLSKTSRLKTALNQHEASITQQKSQCNITQTSMCLDNYRASIENAETRLAEIVDARRNELAKQRKLLEQNGREVDQLLSQRQGIADSLELNGRLLDANRERISRAEDQIHQLFTEWLQAQTSIPKDTTVDSALASIRQGQPAPFDALDAARAEGAGLRAKIEARRQ